MKIAVPWPVKESSQERIKVSLSLWDNKDDLLICLVEPSDDPFLNDFRTYLLQRNSTDIGTKIKKPFIHDMVAAVRYLFPDEKWVGFGNSDLVPVGNIIENEENYEVLIYHRTDINNWEDRINAGKQVVEIPEEVATEIRTLREQGESDKKIARYLNRNCIVRPLGCDEWTYQTIRQLFSDQGSVFFWGQDLYLFRKDIVDRVLSEYLKPNDPILGTGGFDPRLTYWCLSKFHGARVLNKVFHKRHDSEWHVDEVEYAHNGGDISLKNRILFYNQEHILSFCKSGHIGAVPKYMRYMLCKDNPELKDKLKFK